MDNYQIEVYEKFSNYIVDPKYGTYPPYHTGKYLEDYFIEYYKTHFVKDKYFIPVSWTSCYNDNHLYGLQYQLSLLDNTKEYFVVSQHDDAIKENLPSNTKIFNAGGNSGRGNPIPLICSSIPKEFIKEYDKDIFCSFVGALTHPIRNIVFNHLKDKDGYSFNPKNWRMNVLKSDMEQFFEISQRSVFTLCPRGYGRSSFRLYECFQLNTIPVIVYDDKWLPFEDKINWNEISVLVHYTQISELDNILKSFNEEQIENFLIKGKAIYQKFFTLERVSENIINYLNG